MPAGVFRHHEPLARHTSWAVGGPARLLYQPTSLEELVATIGQLPPPLAFLGLGSNLWVSDQSHPISVINFHPGLNQLALSEGLIYAEAGVSSPKLARFAAHSGHGGAEFLAGIPGTVGGALAMNAGCYGSSTWDHVIKVLTLDQHGQLKERSKQQFETGYRRVRGLAAGEAFVAAWFGFERGDKTAALAKIKQLLNQRALTQPLSSANAGSVFVNPSGDHAARLIEACGLKGYRIGGAEISKLHANFIVNPERQASASDIAQLMQHTQEQVLAQQGTRLETEVRMWGER